MGPTLHLHVRRRYVQNVTTITNVGDQLAASLNRRKPSARDQQDAESQAHDATSDGSSHVLGAAVVYTRHTMEVHHVAVVGGH